MERRALAGGPLRRQKGPCFAVPTAIFELLAQELTGQRVVWFLEIRTNAENSAVDAGLGFAVKVRPVVERLEHQPFIDTVDHSASLLAGGIEAEVHQEDQAVERNKVPLRFVTPAPGTTLLRENLGAPAFGGNAGPLGCNGVGGFTGEVPHDLPTDG